MGSEKSRKPNSFGQGWKVDGHLFLYTFDMRRPFALLFLFFTLPALAADPCATGKAAAALDKWERFLPTIPVWKGGAIWIGTPSSGAAVFMAVCNEFGVKQPHYEICEDHFVAFVPGIAETKWFDAKLPAAAKKKKIDLKLQETILFEPTGFRPWLEAKCRKDRDACLETVSAVPAVFKKELQKSGLLSP